MTDRPTMLIRNAVVPVNLGGTGREEPVDVTVADGLITDVRPAGRSETGAGRSVDATGGCLIPGFVDAHTHLGWGAQDRWTVSWEGIQGREEATAEVRRVADRIPDRDLWIGGGDWVEDLSEEQVPDRFDLDRVAANPVLLTRHDGAAAVLNSRAMQLCGIHRDSQAPAGGVIERDADGKLTGRLFGEAVRSRLAVGVVPPRTRHRQLAEMRSLMSDLAQRGITEVHDIGTYPETTSTPIINHERSFTDVSLLDELAADGQLGIRVAYRPTLHRVAERDALLPRDRSGLVTFGGFKLSLDNGWYSDRPKARWDSFRYPGADKARRLMAQADATGDAVSIHAMGDLGVREALDLIATLRPRRGTPLPPHRVIHARRISSEDVLRCAELGVVVESQPWEIVGSGPTLMARGDTTFASQLSPYREMLEAGVLLTFSSDRRLGMRQDLLDADPLVGIQIAVTRTDPTSSAGAVLQPEQAISAAQALRCATTAGSRSLGAVNRGEVTPGSAADLVLLDRDPTAVPPDEIASIAVLLTVCDGRVLHQAERAGAS